MKPHLKNLLSSFGTDALIRITGFVTTALLARNLGGSAFGIISLGLTILSYGVLFSTIGLNITGTRMVAQNRLSSKFIIRHIFVIRLLLATIVFSIIALIIFLSNFENATKRTVLVYLVAVFPMSLHLDWYFHGIERIYYTNLGSIIASVSFMIFIFLFMPSANDISYVAIGYVCSIGLQTISYFLLYLYLPKHDTGHSNTLFEKPMLKPILSQSISIGAAGIISQSLVQFPILLLAYFSVPEEIGLYSTALKIIVILLVIDRVVYLLFFPAASRNFKISTDRLSHLLNSTTRYVIAASAPLCIYTILYAKEILSIVFGTNYASASTILKLLSIYFFTTILNTIFSYTLVSMGKEKNVFKLSIPLSLLTLALMTILTFYFNGIGAAAGLAIGESLIMIGMAFTVKQFLPVSIMRNVTKIFLGIFSMCVMYLFTESLHFFVSNILSVLTYLIVLLITKTFTKSDVQFLKERFV